LAGRQTWVQFGSKNIGIRSNTRVQDALLEWKAGSLYAAEMDFVFPSLRRNGRKPLDLAAMLNRKIKPAFVKVGISGVGWHTFRHSVGSILAGMGKHQLTIRDYLRQGRLVDAILPTGLLSASKSTLVQ
jgi:integrase